MNCQDIEPLLAELLGGELDEARARDVRQHVDACPACRREVDELRRAADMLRGLDTVDARQAARRTASLYVMRRRNPAVRLVYAALRAAAFVAIGTWLGFAWSAGRPVPKPPIAPGPYVLGEVEPNLPAVHASWKDRATKARPAQSSFARNLTLIARERTP